MYVYRLRQGWSFNLASYKHTRTPLSRTIYLICVDVYLEIWHYLDTFSK